MKSKTAFSLAFGLVVVTSALVGALLPRDLGAQLLSPGKLSSDHKSIDGDANCTQCHTSGRRLDTQSCLSCHDDLAVKIRRRTGLHGMEYLGQSCGDCHTEHLGRSTTLVRWPGGSKDRLDHKLTGWPLRGEHAPVECAECHNDVNRRGHKTYLGAKTACATCHEDPHKGNLGEECASCHSEKGWEVVANIEENHPGVSLANGHSGVKCETCHDNGNAEKPSVGTTCISCHEQVHEANFGNKCESCHKNIKWQRLPRRVGLKAHSRTPFPLKGMHSSVSCNSCHRPRLSADRRFRQLKFQNCADCHKDVHRGQLKKFEGNGNCASCHTEHGFWPTQFGIEAHAHASFPLDGKHQAVPCSQCHESRRPRRSLRLDEKTCNDCHDNPHGSQFATEMKENGCASCHSATGWDAPKIDHNQWPLTGVHASTSCESCHTASAADRKRGKGATYADAPTQCSGCHQDIHAGQFRLSEPELPCSTCHDTTEFKISEFDHEEHARYPLEGGHTELACVACHQKERLRNGKKAIRYRLGYRECADCHADPHSKKGPGR